MKKTYLFLLSIFMLIACSEDEINNSNQPKYISLPIHVLSTTRISVVTNGMPTKSIPNNIDEGDKKENYQPKDIWILQFNSSSTLVSKKYYKRGNYNNIPFLMGQHVTIAFIANTHDPHKDWSNVSSFFDLEEQFITIKEESDCYNKRDQDLLMSAVYKDIMINQTKTVFSVDFKRNVVKLQFGLTDLLGCEMDSIQVCNVPNLVSYIEASFNGQILSRYKRQSFINYKKEKFDANKLYYFYVPCNYQNKSVSTSALDKNLHAPEHATYVSVTMKKEGKKLQVKLYPGENDYNDYTMKPNYYYIERFTINSISDFMNTDDSRCTIVKE